MSTYRVEWPCCGSVTETEAWEPESCPFCTPDKPAALAQRAVPEGFALVPKKIEGEMREVLIDRFTKVGNGACLLYDDIWRDLLAAAPAAPQASQGPAEAHGPNESIRQALEALESASQPVEHILPFSNVCDCTQCGSVRAIKSAKAILRAAVAQ